VTALRRIAQHHGLAASRARELASDEALETAEAVAESRGLGEQPAADAARIPGQSASRRGAQRIAAAPAENWSVAANPASSTTDAVWTAAERQQFAARGGIASAIATAVSAKSSASFNPEEALDVSEGAILALFGQNRSAVLRMAGLPLQKECEKDWKMRCAQAKEYEKQGRKVPPGFTTPQWFFTFQVIRMLRRSTPSGSAATARERSRGNPGPRPCRAWRRCTSASPWT
jgi:hypothetical protein